MSDGSYQSSPSRSSDAPNFRSPIMSHLAYWARHEPFTGLSQDPDSPPSFRPSAVISRGLSERMYAPGGDLDSQIGSLAWAEMRGYGSCEEATPVKEERVSSRESSIGAGGPAENEHLDIDLLRLHCADLEADRERLVEEVTQLRAELAIEREQVATWKTLAKTARGSIRKAMERLAEAGEVLLV